MKEIKHNRNVGDIVTFEFFDGCTYTGKITKLTYSGDNIETIKTRYDMPTYKIRVDNPKGFTVYPSITENRVVKVDKTALAVSKDASAEWNKKSRIHTPSTSHSKPTSELDKAIDAQKKFINK